MNNSGVEIETDYEEIAKKHDIASPLMQKKIKRELRTLALNEMKSKRGKETTIHFCQFREALSAQRREQTAPLETKNDNEKLT
jgi:hypothetical protein